MNTDMTERELAEIILAQGGRLYRVGGCVRDAFRGFQAKDKDYCVTGMVKKNFKELFPQAKECGKAFPVFLLNVDGLNCEIAFARTERKVGTGYLGFKVSCKPKVTIEEDLYRRDTTVNSMAQDCLSGEIIDPYGGREDLKKRLLRATSEHFSEDPIRALRLAGQAARMGFAVEAKTLAMASATAKELQEEPSERILAEMIKALREAAVPSTFFHVLREANLLAATFCEIAELEAEKFKAMMFLLDETAKISASIKVRFAGFGLFLGANELARWNSRMVLPGEWLESAIKFRQTAELLTVLSAENLVQAIAMLGRGSFGAADFVCLAQAAKLQVPNLVRLKEVLVESANELPADLKGKEIGFWLKQRQVAEIAKLMNLAEFKMPEAVKVAGHDEA